MQAEKRLLGIMGGTFDPVHYGHLRTALEFRQLLSLDEVRLIPSAVPPHRPQPLAGSAARLAMLQIAVDKTGFMKVDERELARGGHSYTVDTLLSIREEINAVDSVCMLLGSDAFCNLQKWDRWERILELCNLVVASRPGFARGEGKEVLSHYASCLVSEPGQLSENPAGKVLVTQFTQLDISATAIRHSFATGQSPRFLLPQEVINYINMQGLYGKQAEEETVA